MKTIKYFYLAIQKFVIIFSSYFLKKVVLHVINTEKRIHGDSEKIFIANTASFNNALFNTMSGCIYIDEYSFAGHNVSLLTGTHDYKKFNIERQLDIPLQGNDIKIGKGVWICSNTVIIGPCNIGDNSVITAGAVVITDIPSNSIYGGVPARFIKKINFE